MGTSSFSAPKTSRSKTRSTTGRRGLTDVKRIFKTLTEISGGFSATTNPLNLIGDILFSRRAGAMKIGRTMEKYLPHAILFALGVEYGIHVANDKKVKSLKEYVMNQISDPNNQIFLKKIYDFVFSASKN